MANNEQDFDWGFSSPPQAQAGFSLQPSDAFAQPEERQKTGASFPADLPGGEVSFDDFRPDPAPSAVDRRRTGGRKLAWAALVLAAAILGSVLFLTGATTAPASGPQPGPFTAAAVTAVPTQRPTAPPTPAPTAAPTARPTAVPTSAPTNRPTPTPRLATTPRPTLTPSPRPTATAAPGLADGPGEPSGSLDASWYDPSLRWYYPQLTDREQQMIRALYQAITAYEPVTFTIRGDYYTETEQQRISRVLSMDFPELFQYNSYKSTYSKRDGMTTITVESTSPHCTKAEYARRCAQIRQAIREIQASLSPSASDFDKEFACYKYLIEHCEYQIDLPRTGNAYSSICYGYAQCAGYARGLCLLLRCMSVPCVCVWSSSHEWNYVRLDGVWYQCDVTWDDPEGGNQQFYGRQPANLTYLNLPDRVMLQVESHQILPEITAQFILPACTAIQQNYCCREGIYLAPGTANPRDEIARQIRQRYAAGQTRILIWADGSAEYDAAKACADDIYSIVSPGHAVYYFSDKTYVCYLVLE